MPSPPALRLAASAAPPETRAGWGPRAALLAAVVLGLVGLALLTIRSSGQPVGGDAPPAAVAAPTVRTCPQVEVDPLPPPWVVSDRVLKNLGDNLLGRSVTFGDGSRSFTVHVGVEALDQYEDLDFDERPGRIGTRAVRLLEARAVDQVVAVRAVTWTEEGMDAADRCANLSVITASLPEADLSTFVRSVRLGA